MKKTSSTIIGLMCAVSLAIPYAEGQAVTQETSATQQSETQQAQTQQTAPPAVDTTPAFSDVNAGDDHYIAIKFLKDRHIIDGYSDGTFQPLKEINRAEALKIILGTINKTPEKDILTNVSLTFSDVDPSAWYAPYIKKGLQNQIIGGYPDGTFQPDQTINRVESLKMVLLEENHELPVTIDTAPYSDVPADTWFAPYAQVSKDRGLILEDRAAGALNPDEPMNRGDFAELIYRLLESTNGYKFGRATYYADSLAGYGTASGDPYNPMIYTVAHKTLPMGTLLKVTNLANGQSVEVKVNDRGPYATGVELDLSKSAFAAIADPSTGIIVTQFQIISQPSNG